MNTAVTIKMMVVDEKNFHGDMGKARFLPPKWIINYTTKRF